MIHSPNFAKCLQETEFTFHCVWYIEPVYSTGRVAISQKANEIQFEFPTKMIGKMVVHNATILRSLPNFVVPCYTSQETCVLPTTTGSTCLQHEKVCFQFDHQPSEALHDRPAGDHRHRHLHRSPLLLGRRQASLCGSLVVQVV